MANEIKNIVLSQISKMYGSLQKIGDSFSLFSIQGTPVRIYFRYSKIHPGGKTWYGLRDVDLKLLEGHSSLICFLWDDQSEPIFIPFEDFEDVFRSIEPAADGQFKAQIILQPEGTELYLARIGRFNIDAYIGWALLESQIKQSGNKPTPEFSHSQIQTLISGIGQRKNYDLWIPYNDRSSIDSSLVNYMNLRESLPQRYSSVLSILQEVDVIWFKKGSANIEALFEVEHSTPIYSGLLRFNDIYLSVPDLKARYSIVANDVRRSLFIRQLNRPTFRTSGLSELCTFFDYGNVFNWYQRLSNQAL